MRGIQGIPTQKGLHGFQKYVMDEGSLGIRRANGFTENWLFPYLFGAGQEQNRHNKNYTCKGHPIVKSTCPHLHQT